MQLAHGYHLPNFDYLFRVKFQIATVIISIEPRFDINPRHVGNIINQNSAITFWRLYIEHSTCITLHGQASHVPTAAADAARTAAHSRTPNSDTTAFLFCLYCWRLTGSMSCRARLGKRIAKRQNVLYVAPNQNRRRGKAGRGFIRKNPVFARRSGRPPPPPHPLPAVVKCPRSLNQYRTWGCSRVTRAKNFSTK